MEQITEPWCGLVEPWTALLMKWQTQSQLPHTRLLSSSTIHKSHPELGLFGYTNVEMKMTLWCTDQETTIPQGGITLSLHHSSHIDRCAGYLGAWKVSHVFFFFKFVFFFFFFAISRGTPMFCNTVVGEQGVEFDSRGLLNRRGRWSATLLVSVGNLLRSISVHRADFLKSGHSCFLRHYFPTYCSHSKS